MKPNILLLVIDSLRSDQFQNAEKTTAAPQRLGPPGNTVSFVLEDPS